MLAAAAGTPLAAQEPTPADASFFERLGLDRLRLSALGASVGAVSPTQIEATEAYSVHADYGEFTPGWRVVFNATVWSSQYEQETLDRFRDTLRKVIDDPTGDASLDVGRVTVSDVTLGADVRWTPRRLRRAFVRPYAGLGVAAHVLNAEGRAISGTFVERALDNITTGVAGTAGVDLVLFSRVSVGGQVRYDLLSGARFGSLRGVGTYHFGRFGPRGER